MIYTSANRDEEVFAAPDVFDITRSPNPHLSFGIAEHFCLGVHLARLEGRVFFDELLTRFARVEQTGDALRMRSNLNNALKALPVRLSA
jgi:cytochrome P450